MILSDAVIEIERLHAEANNSDDDGSEREARAYSRVLALLATARLESAQLVDWTYLYALEGSAWPDRRTITQPLIALAGRRPPTQADANRLMAGATLKQLLEAENDSDQHTRSDPQLSRPEELGR